MDTRDETIRELTAALGNLLEQVYQMQGMFDDDDNAIAQAVADAEQAEADGLHHTLEAKACPVRDQIDKLTAWERDMLQAYTDMGVPMSPEENAAVLLRIHKTDDLPKAIAAFYRDMTR